MGSVADLVEERLTLVSRSRAIIDRATQERRDLSSDEEIKFNTIMDVVDSLKTKIDAALRPSRASRARADGSPGVRLASYRAWLRTGVVGAALRDNMGYQFPSEYRDQLAANLEDTGVEARDTVVSSDPRGGYLVTPYEVSADIVTALNDSCWVRGLATITGCNAAAKLGVRLLTTRMDDGAWTTEVAPVTEDVAAVWGRRDLEPRLLSKMAKVSYRSILVSSRPEEAIQDELVAAFSRSEERAFLTGDGVGKPLGVFTAAPEGIDTSRDWICAASTTVAGDDIIDCKYSLHEGILNDPSLAWVVSREFVRRVRKLKVAAPASGGDELAYLWTPGLSEGAPDKILGVPYRMSEYAPAVFSSGKYVAVIGAWKYYRIAEIEAMLIQRLTERFALTNEYAFIGRRFVDGAPVMPSAFARLRLL